MKGCKLGIDVGSTTVKVVILNHYNKIVYSNYKRHFSDIKTTLNEVLENCIEDIGNETYSIT